MFERLQIINPFFAKSTVMLQQVGKYLKRSLPHLKGLSHEMDLAFDVMHGQF
jgi:hypothetical protein